MFFLVTQHCPASGGTVRVVQAWFRRPGWNRSPSTSSRCLRPWFVRSDAPAACSGRALWLRSGCDKLWSRSRGVSVLSNHVSRVREASKCIQFFPLTKNSELSQSPPRALRSACCVLPLLARALSAPSPRRLRGHSSYGQVRQTARPVVPRPFLVSGQAFPASQARGDSQLKFNT